MPGESRRGSKALSHASYDLLDVVVRPKKYYRVSNQGSSTGLHKMIVVDPNEKWRILKNVVVLSIALMIQYVAYQGTLNLQSSLNAENGLGTIALSVIYFSMGLSCLILPSWLISRLTCKWTLVLSMSCFVPYIGFQLYSKFYTLIPAGILLGIAAAPMWAAQATYLTQIGQIYAVIRKKNMDGIITLFFGVFFFAWQNADTIGNLLSSVALKDDGSSEQNSTTVNFAVCGAHFCPSDEAEVVKPAEKGVRLLILIYLPCIVVAVLIIAVFLDPLKRYGEGRRQQESTKTLLIATFHQMKRTNQQLLIPLTIYIGLEQAWIAAEYTNAFVACVLGVKMIGYVMITWGVVDSCMCAVFGVAMEYIGRTIIIFIGSTVNICTLGFKLYWLPNDSHPWVFYFLAGIWGMGDAVWVTQINGFYGLLFRRHKEAAFSNYRLFESLGFVLGFVYSNLLCIREKIYILLVLLTIGLIGYLAVEVLHQNKQLDYRAHEKYEKLAQELAAERARVEDIEYAKHMANLAHERIVQKAEDSDGEVDELEDDVTIKRRTEELKTTGNKE